MSAFRLLDDKDRPYGVSLTTVDGVYIRQTIVPRRETFLPQHAHAWDHATMVARGAVLVWKDGKLDRKYSAPEAILIKAGVKHAFLTEDDNTLLYCIHNLHGAEAVKVLEEHDLTAEDLEGVA